MDVDTKKREKSAPKGVIGCLTTGFEVLSYNAGLIALPVVLDLVLWLGPRISIAPLLNRFTELLLSQAAADPEIAFQLEQAQQLLRQISERFNLLSLLGGLPLLQLPSLLSRRAPGSVTPLGDPSVFYVSNIFAVMLFWGGLVLVGLMFGFLYLNGLAQRVRAVSPYANEADSRDEQASVSTPQVKLIHFLLFAVGLLGSGLVFLSVWALAVAIGTAIVDALGILLWMMGVAAASYAGFHLIFVVPGMLLGGRGIMQAILESVLLSHEYLSSVVGLVVLVIVIYEGLQYAWSLPSGDSWLLLIGILGNAIVATGLSVATFVFYQERVRGSG